MQAPWFYFQRDDHILVSVKGKDHQSFLQNMLTQDLRTLKNGDLTPANFCTNKGKLIAEMLVYKMDDQLLLELPTSNVEQFIQTISNYVISEDVEFKIIEDKVFTIFSLDNRSLEKPYRIKCAKRSMYQALSNPHSEEINLATRAQFEQFRILEGIPVFGQDITSDNFPVESEFLSHGISYTKGCYIGQETMARLHSRGGHVAHKLMGVKIAAKPQGMMNSLVMYENKEVGKITSVTALASGETIGLSLVHRSAFEPGTSVTVTSGAESYPAQLLQLPLPLM